MTDHTRPLSQVEVEQRILSVISELEKRTEDYDDIARAAANAEADYKRDHALVTLAVIQQAESRMTVDERSARVDAATSETHRAFLTTQSARNSCREALLSLRAHLDALRTLNASIRNQS